MTVDIIEKQLADAEGQLTVLQHAFVDCADDAAERRRIANQLKTTRDRIAELYQLQATHAA
nr:hypothetical protein KPHV_60640 [Kitasatospora purpeofusca]